MERGSINGTPVWVKAVDYSGQERTVVKESPGVDGAVVEVQGQAPSRYRLDFTLIKDGEWITDDYDVASLELRAAFLSGGPFTVSAPGIGELTDLWMAGEVNLRFFDDTKKYIAEGSCSFIEGEPTIILGSNAIADIENAIAAFSFAAIQDFGNRVPTGLSTGALARLGAFNLWISGRQGRIGSGLGIVSNLSASIQILSGSLENLLNAPKNFASRLLSTVAGLLSLIPSLSKQGDKTTSSAAVQDANDKAAGLISESLTTGAVFDDGLPTIQAEVFADNPSTEDLAEADEVEAVRLLCLAAVTSGACLAISATTFTTLNSVLLVAEALDVPFATMFSISSIDYRSLAQARALRAGTRRYLSELSVGLPRLRTFTTTRTTDTLSLANQLYPDLVGWDQVQAAIDSLDALNTFPDGTEILAGTEITYLDRIL